MTHLLISGTRHGVIMRPEINEYFAQISILAIEGTYLHRHCQINRIPCQIISISDDIEEILGAYDFDIYLSHGSPHILSGTFIENCRREKRTLLNLHPSVLPYFKGSNGIIRSLIEKKGFGCSLHHINEKIDEGDVIDFEEISVTDDMRDVPFATSVINMIEAEVFFRAIRSKLEKKNNSFSSIDPKYDHDQFRYSSFWATPKIVLDKSLNFDWLVNFCAVRQEAPIRLRIGPHWHNLHGCSKVSNKWLVTCSATYEVGMIVFCGGRSIVIKSEQGLYKLDFDFFTQDSHQPGLKIYS